jgi:hypothetical protein
MLGELLQQPRAILWGATASVLGISLALLVDAAVGGSLLCVGVVASAVGLHRLGRSGSDEFRA